MNKNLLIRCDNRSNSGVGHLKRSLILANCALKNGFNPFLLVDQKIDCFQEKINFPLLYSSNINQKSLAISENLKLAFPDNYLNYALIGGEDYELLFSAPKSMNSTLLDIFEDLNIKLSQIGEIRKGQSEIFLDNELTDVKGWDHFENQL